MDVKSFFFFLTKIDVKSLYSFICICRHRIKTNIPTTMEAVAEGLRGLADHHKKLGQIGLLLPTPTTLINLNFTYKVVLVSSSLSILYLFFSFMMGYFDCSELWVQTLVNEKYLYVKKESIFICFSLT